MSITNQIQLGMFRWVVCAVVSFTCLGNMLAQTSDQNGYLYRATVLHDGATVHSGPGNVHYATDQLALGAVVEVYREDPGGWCAIRPVDGSFSLIPASKLEITGDGIGRILESGTPALVGTRLGAVDKPMAQVKLREGEEVIVLGQVSSLGPDGQSNNWYQIGPPNGEFRWIRMSDIQLPPSVAKVNSIQPSPDPLAVSGNPSESVRSLNEIVSVPQLDLNTSAIAANELMGLPNNLVQQATLQSELLPSRTQKESLLANVNRGWRPTSRPIGSSNAENDALSNDGFGASSTFETTSSMNVESPREFQNSSGFTEQRTFAGGYSDEAMRIANADRSSMASDLYSVRGAANMPNPLGQRLVSGKMSDLELQLTSEMIKQDPSAWKLEDLEIAATTVYRSALDPTERSLAEKFLAKIENCKTIRAGYRNNANGAIGSGARATSPIGLGVNSDVELGTTYDAHGWLTELVRDGGNSRSEYALQDTDGKITHHIAPAPGMNLRRYLKSRVGVIGQRGYHSKLKLDHVTAHRVIELEKPSSTIR